jgi:hypothetical protein
MGIIGLAETNSQNTFKMDGLLLLGKTTRALI